MPAARENLDTPLIITIGVLLVILTFVLILLLQAWFFQAQGEEYDRKVTSQRSEELATLVAAQEETLHSYRWIDKDKGVVGIPIDRAMDIIVREGL